MRILAIGDIIGDKALDYTFRKLPQIKKDYSIDFVIANGENSAVGNGITMQIAKDMQKNGIDVITLGNHTFTKKDAVNVLLNNQRVIRPINFPEKTVGKGSVIVEKDGKRIAVINALGRINLMNCDCPFKAVEKELSRLKGKCDISILDFHAETSSEKLCMGFYLDGKISAVYGTHTHVATADERILPEGTGYISDIGMTGVSDSVLGVKKEIIIRRIVDLMPQKFEIADGRITLSGVIFEFDDTTNKCIKAERISV